MKEQRIENFLLDNMSSKSLYSAETRKMDRLEGSATFRHPRYTRMHSSSPAVRKKTHIAWNEQLLQSRTTWRLLFLDVSGANLGRRRYRSQRPSNSTFKHLRLTVSNWRWETLVITRTGDARPRLGHCVATVICNG